MKRLRSPTAWDSLGSQPDKIEMTGFANACEETQGSGRDFRRLFRAAWERFASEEADLTEFLNAKRKRR
jgi:hypothetical protein